MQQNCLLILLLCSFSLLIKHGDLYLARILIVAGPRGQNSTSLCYGSNASAGAATNESWPIVCLPDLEIISARYGRASVSEQ